MKRLLVVAVLWAGAVHAEGLKAFYFGNSYLENSVPWFHPYTQVK